MPLTDVKYVFVLPVWGGQYLDRFLQYGLPTQLAPGNLPRMPAGSRYRIFTLSQDGKALRKSRAFRRLRSLMPTSLDVIDDFDLSDSVAAMCECHMRALAEANASGAALFILHPDTLWSDGTFERIHRIMQRGKRVIMIACPRIHAETALPELRERFLGHDGISIVVNSRELVELGLRHLHPVAEAHHWERYRNTYPAHYYWRIEQHGLLIRSFDLTHVVIKPETHQGKPVGSIRSQHFVRLNFPMREDIYVVTDSDEVCGFEFSSSDHWCETIAPQAVPNSRKAEFIYEWTNDYHCSFAQEKIRLHARALDASWDPAERESDQAIAELLQETMKHYGQDRFTQRPMVHPVAAPVVKQSMERRAGQLIRRLRHPLLSITMPASYVGPFRPSIMTADGPYGYWVDLKPFGIFAPSDRDSVSRVELLEEGKPLERPRRLHAAIKVQGMGRYSHWGDSLCFSTSDNTDPRTNGRSYVLRVPQTLGSWLRRLAWKARQKIARLRSWIAFAR